MGPMPPAASSRRLSRLQVTAAVGVSLVGLAAFVGTAAASGPTPTVTAKGYSRDELRGIVESLVDLATGVPDVASATSPAPTSVATTSTTTPVATPPAAVGPTPAGHQGFPWTWLVVVA